MYAGLARDAYKPVETALNKKLAPPARLTWSIDKDPGLFPGSFFLPFSGQQSALCYGASDVEICCRLPDAARMDQDIERHLDGPIGRLGR
jgi:hypothetical protein